MAVQTHAGRRRYVLVLIVLTALTLATLDKRSGESGPIGTVGRFAQRVDDPGFGVAVQINKVFGDAVTQNDGTMHVVFSVDTRASPRARPKPGDVALTCGCHDSNFPAGIPVGTVTRVVQDGPSITVT